MTAQINDTFRYRNHEYAVAGISEGELFDPSLLDLEPAGTCTACWRGYQAVFALSDSHLVLDTLHVNLLKPGDVYEREEGPEINGVKPGGPRGERDWFNNHYEGLDYHLEYTGGLLLADGFIKELYVHMGFHRCLAGWFAGPGSSPCPKTGQQRLPAEQLWHAQSGRESLPRW